MGTTFVGIDDRGFWMNDSFLELWLRLLALHVKDPVEPGSLETEIRDQWLLASRGFFDGCIPDGLAEAVSTPAGEALTRAAIHSLLQALDAAPSHLGAEVLNLMGIAGTFTTDMETWRLIQIGHAYLDLIDGKITADSDDTSFMPGMVKPPENRQDPTTPAVCQDLRPAPSLPAMSVLPAAASHEALAKTKEEVARMQEQALAEATASAEKALAEATASAEKALAEAATNGVSCPPETGEGQKVRTYVAVLMGTEAERADWEGRVLQFLQAWAFDCYPGGGDIWVNDINSSVRLVSASDGLTRYEGAPWCDYRPPCPFLVNQRVVLGYVEWEWEDSDVEDRRRWLVALIKEGRGAIGAVGSRFYRDAVATLERGTSNLQKFGFDDGAELLTRDDGEFENYRHEVSNAFMETLARHGVQAGVGGPMSTCHNVFRLCEDGILLHGRPVDIDDRELEDTLAKIELELWGYDFSLMDTLFFGAIRDDDLADIIASRWEELVETIDHHVGRQLDDILHHPDFQAMERAYRGLWFLVERTDFRENIEIELSSCTKEELQLDFEDTPTLADSALYKLLHGSGDESGNRLPHTAVIADFQVNPSSSELFFMLKLASLGHYARCPVIVDVPLTMFENDRVRRAQPHDFRGSEAARYIVLALSRFLLRAPYAIETEELVYHESAGEGVWGSASLAFGAHLTTSFARDRWASDSSVPIEGLPVSAEGRSLEFAVSEGLERELSRYGYSALIPGGSGQVHFPSASVLHRPSEPYRNPKESGPSGPEVYPETQFPHCFLGIRVAQRSMLGP